MHKVVFLDRAILPGPMPTLSFPHTWEEYETTYLDEIDERVADATIVISSKIPLRAETLKKHPSIKFIAVAAAGVDPFDVEYCKEAGVVISNVAGYAKNTVPEHAFMMLLALSRNLLPYRQDMENDAWQKSKPFCACNAPIFDLHNKTIGVVGSGSIGQGVAKIARGFGMNVVFSAHPSAQKNYPNDTFMPFEQLLEESDVITLHCPLTEKTRNFISTNEFQRMKPNAYLINTARGPLIDEQALIVALQEGQIAGAGLDVISKEPPNEGNPLLDLNLPNLIVTPHVAWIGDEALDIFTRDLLANIESFAAGKPINRVA